MRIRDEKKEQLVIEKAMELIVAEGFDGFSMNKLAKASGISVATLYIYYKDRDDLFKKIGSSIGDGFFTATLKDFDPGMPFAEGLRQQWKNRADYAFSHPRETCFFEIIRHSPYHEAIMQGSLGSFKEMMGAFYRNSVERKELIPLPMELYWSVAYGPLYTLLRFHNEGKNMAGKPFTLSRQMLDQALELAIKALTP